MLAELITKNYDQIRLVAYGICLDNDLTDELVQNSIIRAMKSEYKEIGSFMGWMFFVIKSEFLSMIERKNRKKRANIILTDKMIDGVYEPDYDTKELLSLVKGIAPTCYMAAKGYRHKEIAQQLGLKVLTIKSRIYKERKMLAKCVDFS